MNYEQRSQTETCYSNEYFELNDDFVYKYRGVYININYFTANDRQVYKKLIPGFGVGLISKFDSNIEGDWSVTYLAQPLVFEELAPKVRAEIRKANQILTYHRAPPGDLSDQEIVECYLGAMERVGSKGKHADDYLRQVRAHFVVEGASVFLARYNGRIAAIALVNIFHRQKIINLKNLKINYGLGLNATGLAFIFHICGHFTKELYDGFKLHAGTSSVRHGNGFHIGLLQKKLKFQTDKLSLIVVFGAHLNFLRRIVPRIIGFMNLENRLFQILRTAIWI